MKLSKRQRTALEKSIKKWELIVSGEGTDSGLENCELCKLYVPRKCVGCPVRKKVKQTDCYGSPWVPWARYQSENEFHWRDKPLRVFDPHSKKLAQAELDFLRSILSEATS